MQDAQAGRLDRRQVDQAIELRRIGGLRIEDLDLSLALSIIETNLANPAAALHPLDLLL